MTEKRIVLKKGREQSIRRRHPWIFSGGVSFYDPDLNEGDIVKVYDFRDNFLCTGHYQKSSITVRILSFNDVEIDKNFWFSHLLSAYKLRVSLGIASDSKTTCYRLINAEGDGLSGLIIDIYGSAAVIECHSQGMLRSLPLISESIKKVYGSGITTIFDKSKIGNNRGQDYLLGDEKSGIVKENGFQFDVDWANGQKTGFFLDQRDNRALLGHYSKGKSVLNTFCYTGGFSVYALGNGASKVISVDISKPAIELTTKNMDLNKGSSIRHEISTDVMKYLKENNTCHDILVVDPPAFAKSQKKRHNAVQAYKRLNALALKRINSHGLLFTFSCSQVVDRSLFTDTLRAAAIESQRRIQIVHNLSQPADHPTNIYHPEGAYLKGLVLKVY